MQRLLPFVALVVLLTANCETNTQIVPSLEGGTVLPVHLGYASSGTVYIRQLGVSAGGPVLASGSLDADG